MKPRWVLGSLLTLVFSTAMAQQTVPVVSAILARGPAGVQVSAADVLSELRRAPPAERQAILSTPEQVQQIVSNVLVRRVLAIEAERDGLGTDPVVSATLAIARDRVLSDERLARFDAQNTPSEAALDTHARDTYKANLTKFEMPAQTRARHILVDKGEPESLQKAKDLLTQLRAGASFEELAKANSTDQGSAARGGDLGFFGAGKMVKPFEDALNKLSKPGDLSEPVESQFGYHIIRLEERQDKTLRPYADVREQLMGEVRAAILNESRVQKVRELNKNFVFEAEAIKALGKSPSQ